MIDKSILIKETVKNLQHRGQVEFRAQGHLYKIVETRTIKDNQQTYTGKYRLFIDGDLFNQSSVGITIVKTWLSNIKNGKEIEA